MTGKPEGPWKLAKRVIVGSAAVGATGVAAFLVSDQAAGNVDSWPHPASTSNPTSSTRRDASGSPSSVVADPINIVFFNYGRVDGVHFSLKKSPTDPSSTYWESCNRGTKQWLYINDFPHGSDAIWVWASKANNNTNFWDSDGEGWSHKRRGDCDEESGGADRLAYHARLFGRQNSSSHDGILQHSMIAAHLEHCHNPSLGFCIGGHHTGAAHDSWKAGRNRLWADIMNEPWLDANGSYSWEMGNEGDYAPDSSDPASHDTVYFLKCLSTCQPTTGGGGK